MGGEKNVGRGVFQGVKAVIQCNSHEPVLIENNLNRLKDEDRKKLQEYVDVLNHATQGKPDGKTKNY